MFFIRSLYPTPSVSGLFLYTKYNIKLEADPQISFATSQGPRLKSLHMITCSTKCLWMFMCSFCCLITGRHLEGFCPSICRICERDRGVLPLHRTQACRALMWGFWLLVFSRKFLPQGRKKLFIRLPIRFLCFVSFVFVWGCTSLQYFDPFASWSRVCI